MLGAKDPLVDARFSNWLNQSISYVGATHLQVIAGRATSKTTQIHAERSQEAIYEMPRSLQMFLCNTYQNARTNIMPNLIVGWKEFRDWKEKEDYVWGEPPPSYFAKPFVPIDDYKNTISHRNGATIIIGSAAQVSGLAGNSYQKLYADEVKYIGKEKMDIILPALRGFNMFPHSAYYLGTTFTTDLPNLGKGDEPWILDYQKNTDQERAKVAFYCGYEYYKNEARLARAIKFKNRPEIRKATKARSRLYAKWLRVRRDLSYFVMSSSFANVDAVTARYIKNLLSSLGWEEFKQSVLTIKGGVEEGEKFYTSLGGEHFTRDGENPGYAERLGLREKPNCLVLKYLDLNAPLDCGIDFGNMMSMVLGQEQGKYYRCLFNLFALGKNNTRELAEHFIEFFKPQVKKVLYMYYDRSGNQYETVGRDWATELKNYIEVDKKGNRTGWKVVLMSKEQATILQSEEYLLMKQIMEENNPDLPKLRLDVQFCRELKSSMELAKIKIKKNRRTSKPEIHKDKSSEKLPLSQLPMNSTNFSDAFKYLLYRKKWVEKIKGRRERISTGLDGVD